MTTEQMQLILHGLLDLIEQAYEDSDETDETFGEVPLTRIQQFWDKAQNVRGHIREFVKENT